MGLATKVSNLRFGGPGQVLLEERLLEPPARGQVTVAVECCGICGTDLHFYSGKWPPPAVTPGHEFTGAIQAVGPAVSRWSTGDRVVIEPVVGCGACRSCLEGNQNLCNDFRFLGVSLHGGFAPAVNVPESCLHAVPAGMPAALAALAEPLAVAIHAARTAPIKPGDSVAICGAGAIGLLSVAAALEQGAGGVISSGRHQHQRELAARLGARAVAPDDLEAAVSESTAGRGVDVVLETVGGSGQTLGQATGVVRSGGSVVLVGGFTRPSSMHLARVVNREIRLLGSSCYSRASVPTDFETALGMLSSQGSILQELVTGQYPLPLASDAFAAAASKESGSIKVQVCPVDAQV